MVSFPFLCSSKMSLEKGKNRRGKGSKETNIFFFFQEKVAVVHKESLCSSL